MKKILYLILPLMLLFTLVSCGKNKEITLSYDSNEITIYVGETVNIKPNIDLGKKVKDCTLKYNLSSAIATVDSQGLLTANAAGTIIVTVTAEESKEAEVKITVVIKEKTAYTVTLDVNGGTAITPNTITFKEGETVTLPTPTKEGYTFLGWYENDVLVETITNKNYELVAKWERNVATFTISYDCDGGTLPEGATTSFVEDEAVVLPTPTKEGYTFLGWYENDVLVETITNKNYELVAKWSQNPVTYVITYDTDGGTLPEGATTSFVENEVVVLPTPTKEGYTFLGWYENDALVETITNKNYQLIAKWEEVVVTYTIKYNVSGGTLPKDAVKSFAAGESVTLPTPTKNGYDFIGWYENDVLVETITDKNYNLVAKWDGQMKTITYKLNDGELSGDYPTEYKVGVGVELPIPTKDGYEFVGWYTSSTLVGTPITNINTSKKTNITVYASWKVETYDVTYVLNGGNWLYSSREEMVTDFLKDVMEWGGVTRTPDGMVQGAGDTKVGFANVFGSAVYGFFSDSRYSAKWAWLKEYIINVTTNAGSKSSLSSGSEPFWRYSLGAFLFEEHRSSYPVSEDFTSDKAANGFWDTLSTLTTSTFEYPKNETDVKIPVRIYYVFSGWYDNAEFTGNPVTVITGDTTLYAKWVEETPVEKVTITNKVDKLDRFEEYQLEWGIAPSNAAIKEVEFTSSDTSVAIVDEDGIITPLNNGTVTITIKSLSPSGVTDSLTINVSSPDHFDISYETNSYVTIGSQIKLLAEYVKRDASKVNLTWTSLTPNIATVDSGVVTGVAEGVAQIRVAVENDATAYFDFSVTVLSQTLSNELQFIVDYHESNVFTRYNLGIGAGVPVYYDDIISGVSKYLFEDYVVHTDHYIADPYCTTSFKSAGVEFITVHYAADMSGSATQGGENLATFNISKNTSAKDASWHYGVGNDGIWACQSEEWGAWHAGSSKQMTWTNTGIKYSESDPKYATVTLGADNYFYLNGKNTGIANTTSSNRLNQMGLAYRVVNGEYQLGGHYYNSTYNFISSTGGNNNSIGIETSCAEGSDQWLTWQYTAQLVAKLLIKYNLDLTRVVGHHFFSGKDCPQQLLENDMEIWWEFMDMVEAEYVSYTQFKDVKFNFSVVNGYDILDDNGRIISQPKYSTAVTYKVTLSDGTSVTLTTMVPGIYTK